MPRRDLRVARPLDRVWPRLQDLDVWEGVGGLTDLRSAHHDSYGQLRRFGYSIDTPLGSIHDIAEVAPDRLPGRARMLVTTEVRSIAVRVDLEIVETADGCAAELVLETYATSFMARPLASALAQTLESGIDRESARLIGRLERDHVQ